MSPTAPPSSFLTEPVSDRAGVVSRVVRRGRGDTLAVVLALLAVVLAVGSACTAAPAGPGSADGSARSGSGPVDPTASTASTGGSAGFAGVGTSTDPLGSGTPGGSAAPTTVDPTTAAAMAAAGSLLTARSAALAHDDRAAWLATVADLGSRDGEAEAAAFDSLRTLGVTGLRVVAVTPAPGPTTSPGTVRVRVSLGYRVPGVDRGDRVVARTISLAQVGADWRIIRWLGSGDPWEVFDLPGLSVARTDRVLVAGPVPVTQLLARLADAEFAQTVVGRALGSPVPALLVEPGTPDQVAALLGRAGPGDIGPVAASTIGPRSAGAAALADRVVLNPDALSRLTEAGRRVVLAHELTHLAVRASTGHDLPIWLSEGFAEWVAFAPIDMPANVIAARLLNQVRDNGAPAGLPTETDFAAADPATAYQSAWLAVSDLAARIGPTATVAFVRTVGGAPGDGAPADRSAVTDRAFHGLLGMSEGEFVTLWRAGLVARARP